MMRSLLALLVLLAAVGCTSDNPRACSASKACADPATPFCDVDGVLGDTRNTCLPISCAADEPLVCSDDTLYRCNATRDGYEPSPCALGCSDAARCYDLAPSNDLGSYLDTAASAPAIELIDGDVFDVVTGDVVNNGMLRAHFEGSSLGAQGDVLPPLRVYQAQRLTIVGEVRAISTRGRLDNPALAFVIDGAVEIDGTFTLAPAGGNGPPGMPLLGGGGAAYEVTDVMFMLIGGGGGGHATAGGKGGGTSGDVVNSAPGGGQALAHPTLEPLYGGGVGGFPSGQPQLASLGGGAVQISSRTSITLRESSFIDANATLPVRDPMFAAVGGGAGGAILLEAPSVDIGPGAALSALGVGGSSGDNLIATAPGRGARSISTRCSTEGPFCTNGGDGGALEPPGNGSSLVTMYPFPALTGAGGGAAGYVRINTRSGTSTQAPTAVISPPPQRGAVSVR